MLEGSNEDYFRSAYQRLDPHREQWNLRGWLKFFTSSFGQLLLLTFVGFILVFGGTLVWLAVGGPAGEFNLDAWKDSRWLSWTIFFDPGTQTGFAADERSVILWVALLFSVLGFGFNLVLLGWIVDWVRNTLEAWQMEGWTLVESPTKKSAKNGEPEA